jgi:hypothetical protein
MSLELDWDPPEDVVLLYDLVRRPEFAKARICTYCALWLGCKWHLGNSQKFSGGACSCCGRMAPVTLVSSWKWDDTPE